MSIPYCGKCGTKLNKSSNYCNRCGFKLSEESDKLSFILIVLLLLVSYLILNIWAIGQIEFDASLDSMINSISEFNYKTDLTSTEVGTEITIRNPTIIPITITQISYDLSYGERVFAEGGTGFIFIMPFSEISTPIDLHINHAETGLSLIEGVINLFQKEEKSFKMRLYAGFGPIKIPIGESE